MTKSTVLIVALALCTAVNFVKLSAQDFDHETDPASTSELPIGPDEKQALPSDAAAGASDIDFTVREQPTMTEIVDEFRPAESSFLDGFEFSQPTVVSEDVVPGFSDAESASRFDPVTEDPALGTSPSAMPMIAESMKVETEAVIDISEVFRRSLYFASETQSLKVEVEQLKTQMEEAHARLQALGRLLADTEGDRHEELQRQAIELQVEIEVLTSKNQVRLRDAEAEIYLNTYRRVRAVIAEYARENGIHTVRRVRSGVSEDDIDAAQVLEWINSDIVYSADEPRDITQDIIDRLNTAESTAAMPNYPPAYGSTYVPATSATQPAPSYAVPPEAYPGSAGSDPGTLVPSTTLPSDPVGPMPPMVVEPQQF